MCIGMIYHQVEFIYPVFTCSTSFMLQGRGFIWIYTPKFNGYQIQNSSKQTHYFNPNTDWFS
jgi:hypothetical protein